MSRSLKKGPFVDEKLLKKIMAQKESGSHDVIKTWCRRSQISPEFVGHKLGVYNGRKHVEFLVTESMVGYRVGEFSPTRAFRTHGKITKKIISAT